MSCSGKECYCNAALCKSKNLVFSKEYTFTLSSEQKNFILTTLKVKKLHEDAVLPIRAYPTDLGFDLTSIENKTIPAGDTVLVNTGIACNFPAGYGALLRDRSSMAVKEKVFVVAGVIDETYTGEIRVALYNSTTHDVVIEKGQRIAQMIFIETSFISIQEVQTLQTTDRGERGFGSSGK